MDLYRFFEFPKAKILLKRFVFVVLESAFWKPTYRKNFQTKTTCGAFLGRLGVLLGSFGVVLEPSWLVLGRHGVVRVRLGPGVWSRLGRSLRPELR